MYLWSAFGLGLLGSLHCLGMCGPIALALPRGNTDRLGYAVGRVLYNLGRVFTYGLLGALAGAIGQGVAMLGLQRGLSIGLGVLLLVGVLMGPRRLAALGGVRVVQRGVARLKAALGALLQRNASGTLLGIGLLNGLLPCGLVYVAMAGAAATGSAREGVLYMWLFGLGTLPLMLAASLAGHLVVARFRGRLRHVIPIGLALVAVLLIWRGFLNPAHCHSTGGHDAAPAEAAASCCPHEG